MGRLPRKSTFAGDVLEIVLNDQAGEAAAKGVQNKPSTNDEMGITIQVIRQLFIMMPRLLHLLRRL